MASCTFWLIPARLERCSNAIFIGKSSTLCSTPSLPRVVSFPYPIAASFRDLYSVLPSNCDRAVYPPYSSSSSPSVSSSSSEERYPRALRIAP